MNILVTGGAGYIGSHAVKRLREKNHSVVVLDNLSHGHREALPESVTFVTGNTGDDSAVAEILHAHKIGAVMHFAADIEVGESVLDPGKYYKNNFSNSVKLLDQVVKAGVKKFVFSSTAAVYGNPEKNPIDESQAPHPINPYGLSKYMTELALRDFSRAYGLGFAVLRYFNVAGASPEGEIGEAHHPESHLIPRLLAALRDPNGVAKIYGTDYPTPDGTCVRDYVHVCDLVDAHILALEKIQPATGDVFNLGSENGFSVKEVIAACERVAGKKLKVTLERRRAGDSAVLVAANKKAREILGWAPRFPEIETIIAHAWKWHTQHPTGYEKTSV